VSSNLALMGVARKGGIVAITRSLAVAYCTTKSSRQRDPPSAPMTERFNELVAGNAALTRLVDAHLLGLIARRHRKHGVVPRRRRILVTNAT
jgi:hypothetical protein